jgi:ribonuclease HI
MDHEPVPLPTHVSHPAWKRNTFPDIVADIPGIAKRGSQADEVRKTLTLGFIHSHYPKEEWTHVYTDGSATEATRNGGAGVLIQYTDGDEELALPTGIFSSNYRAETEALRAAVTKVAQNPERTRGQVVLLTDALSVLQALRSSRSKELNALTSALTSLSSATRRVVLQWVPAHCSIRGNERADTLAKEGASKPQEDASQL